MNKVLLVLFSLIFASSVWAYQQIPQKCPSVNSVKGSSFIDAYQSIDGTHYIALALARYDVNEPWAFAIGDIIAADKNEALKKANESLKLLTMVEGPQYVYSKDIWACAYEDSTGHIIGLALPMTPTDGLTLMNNFQVGNFK